MPKCLRFPRLSCLVKVGQNRYILTMPNHLKEIENLSPSDRFVYLRKNLSLVGLLYCVRQFPEYREEQASVLPASALTPENAFTQDLTLDHVQKTMVPPAFCQPPLRRGLEQSKESSEIQYLFDDGTAISIFDILFHPYALVIPRDLLPGSSGAMQTTLSSFGIPPNVQNYEAQQREHQIIHLLLKAHMLRRHTGVGLQIAGGLSQREERPVYDVETVGLCGLTSPEEYERFFTTCAPQLNIYPESSQNGQVKAIAELGFSGNENDIIFPNFFYSPQQKHLAFHNFGPLIHEFATGLLKENTLNFSADQTSALSRQWNRFPLESNQQIEKITRRLLRLQPTLSIRYYESDLYKEIEKSELTVQLSNNEFFIGQKVSTAEAAPNHEFVLWNFPAFLDGLLSACQKGLASLPFVDGYNRSQRPKWQVIEKSALQHVGLAHLLLKLAIQAHFSDKEVTAKAVSQNWLDNAEQILQPDHEGQEKETTEWSSEFAALIENTTASWFREWEAKLYFFSEQAYQLAEGYSPYLKMVLSWLRFLSQKTQQKCFARANTAYLPYPKEPEKEPGFYLSPPSLQAPKEVQSYLWPREHRMVDFSFWLDYQKSGQLNLVLNGRPVHQLAESDMKITLSVQAAPAKNHPGGQAKKSAIDWFSVTPNFHIHGKNIDLSELRQLAEQGYIERSDGYWVAPAKYQSEIQPLQKILRLDQPEGSTDPSQPLKRHEVLELLALRARGITVSGDDRWDEICRFYDALGSQQVDGTPPQLKATLKPYQVHGTTWITTLYRLGLGGILADEMGLGKTLQTLAFLESLRQNDEMGFTLTVVPASLIYNWLSEVEKFIPDLPIIYFNARNRNEVQDFLNENAHGIVLCTYGILIEHHEFLADYHWNIHIYDEAQNLKNYRAKRRTVAQQLSAHFRLCLTGTPMENHHGELYSLVDLVLPGSLGARQEFYRTYVTKDQFDDEALELLRQKIRPLLLRRTKSAILKELPEKSEVVIKVAFDDEQEQIYNSIATQWSQKVTNSITSQGERRTQFMMLTALLRLRQVCSDPDALPGIQYPTTPPKIRLISQALKEITESGDSALVFTQFLKTLKRVQEACEKKGIPYVTLHGQLTSSQRRTTIENFVNNPDGAVLISTLKTGGMGLNLTKASYVFHLEPWWNPAVENQATDRVHRLGQHQSVTVYRYIMRESIEEKIEFLKARKRSDFDAILNQAAAAGAKAQETGKYYLSKSDFDYLLGRTPSTVGSEESQSHLGSS